MSSTAAPETVDVILRDGSTLRLRPPVEADRHVLLRFYEELSEQSLYFRFHGHPRVDERLVEPVLEPDWQIQDGHVIEVQGRPTVRTTMQFLPPPDFEAESLADYMVLGHIMTAMPAVNAIPAVVDARPGIVSYADLRLTVPRGLVRL